MIFELCIHFHGVSCEKMKALILKWNTLLSFLNKSQPFQWWARDNIFSLLCCDFGLGKIISERKYELCVPFPTHPIQYTVCQMYISFFMDWSWTLSDQHELVKCALRWENTTYLMVFRTVFIVYFRVVYKLYIIMIVNLVFTYRLKYLKIQKHRWPQQVK